MAVVGLGVGAQHAKAFVSAGCRLKWVHDLDRSKAEAFASEIGVGAVAASYEAILADDEVDAVAIASYDNAHASQVVSALEAGKHVFCEKPLCTTRAELAAISDAWRKHDRHLASNLILRSVPLYRRVRELVRSGTLGRIYAFYGDYLYGRLHKITDGWRADVDDYSVMLGGGVHLVDLMTWITGERPVNVTSGGNRIVTEGSRFRYRDFVTSTFTLQSGSVGVISANFGCVHRHQHVVRIFGSNGSFIYDDMGARLYFARDPGGPPEILHENPLPSSKGDLVGDFLLGIDDRAAGKLQTLLDLSVIGACLAADDALINPAPLGVEVP